MSFVLRVFDKLADQETDEVMKAFWKHFGPLMQISLICPTFRQPYRPYTLILTVLYFPLVFGHLFLIFFTMWIESENFELASTMLHYGLILVVGVGHCVCLNSYRETFLHILYKMASNLGEYQSNDVYEEEEIRSLRKILRTQFLKFLWVPGSMTVGAGSAIFVPYVIHFGAGRYTENGVNLDLPLQLYYPFPTHEGIVHFVVVALQLGAIGVVGLAFLSVLFGFIKMAQHIRFEIWVVCHALKTLHRRAAVLYEKKYPNRKILDLEGSDPDYQECLNICLKDAIIHHHSILEFFELMNTLASWPTALAVFIGGLSIGLSLIAIVEVLNTNDYEALMKFSILLFGEVLNLFVCCTLGEEIGTESMKYYDQLYATEWYLLNVKNRRTLLNMQVGASEPMALRGAGLIFLNHESFATMMNSAYSFFNLVNAGI